MKILIACEFSGIVREAFISRGHDCWSCDLLPTEIKGPHIQDDVLLHLEDGWDMMIAFPPCTYIAGSGTHWNGKIKGRDKLTHEALLFCFSLIDAPIEKICLENPVGLLSTHYRKPDQIIHPWQFGHDASKRTCLWLKNLPNLKPTMFVQPKKISDGQYQFANQTKSGQNRLGSTRRAQDRSRTYLGVAQAMASQWK